MLVVSPFPPLGVLVSPVGITNEEFVTTNESRDGGPAFDYTDCVMEQAYLLSSRFFTSHFINPLSSVICG